MIFQFSLSFINFEHWRNLKKFKNKQPKQSTYSELKINPKIEAVSTNTPTGSQKLVDLSNNSLVDFSENFKWS